MRFHHVGYATADMDRYLEETFIPVFAPLSVSEKYSDETQRVVVRFAQMEGGTTIELVEPFAENNPLKSIVGSNRGGLYHLCYEVNGLEAELARCRRKGFMPLGRPVPAAAFGGRRIVFMLSPQRDLIELLEAQFA